jgi:ribosomal protein S18 acetylase RimI-like enzyme
VLLRPATAADEGVLADHLAMAADWRPETPLRSGAEVRSVPEFSRYVAGWPGLRDRGVIAEIAEAGGPAVVGACWWRFLPADDAGYGFLDESIPEVTIGVHPEHRRRGIGRALLTELIGEAASADVPVLSLSVERDNPARRLYLQVGFVTVEHDDGADTMRCDIAGASPA